MRRLQRQEIGNRCVEIMRIVDRVNAKVHNELDSVTVMNRLMSGQLQAWDHEGVVVIVDDYQRGAVTCSCVLFAAGNLPMIILWYSIWEIYCQFRGVSEIVISGRKGWSRLMRSLHGGFTMRTSDMVKRWS